MSYEICTYFYEAKCVHQMLIQNYKLEVLCYRQRQNIVLKFLCLPVPLFAHLSETTQHISI